MAGCKTYIVPYNLNSATKSSPSSIKGQGLHCNQGLKKLCFTSKTSVKFCIICQFLGRHIYCSASVKRGLSGISWPYAWCRCCPSLRSLHALKQLHFIVFGCIILPSSLVGLPVPAGNKHPIAWCCLHHASPQSDISQTMNSTWCLPDIVTGGFRF